MTFIIAEAGVNHDGSISKARMLVKAARDAGADAVKFQHFNSQRLWGDDRIAHLQLSDAEMVNLSWFCSELGLEFMCTPFGQEEVKFLKPMLRRWKVSSGLLTDHDLLYDIYKTGLPVILSTGMANMAEIMSALGILAANVTLLHCTSAYPCPLAEVNLKAMEEMKSLGYPVGYSDHTIGITVPIAAVARGAVVIEKHITLDSKAEGPDHKCSLEPEEFKTMVQAIRDVETCLGDGKKRVMPSAEQLKRAWS